MENQEKILNKIKNLLDLANHNPNENEAIAAALKAQELMAKYDFSVEDIDCKNNDLEISNMLYKDNEKHTMKKWKIKLSCIIANNFCCKVYRAGTNVVFYGYKKDAEIALEVFRFLFETGNKLAVRFYNQYKKEGKSTKGVMNTYLLGFCEGIEKVLTKQCTALMLVIPKEVEYGYEEMTKGWKKTSTRLGYAQDQKAYETGIKEGKETATARGIE